MMGGHKPPVPMTQAQFSRATVGQMVQIAVRVDSVKRKVIFTELLQHQTDTTAKATGAHVQLYLPEGTPLVMGSATDITPGAILYIYGVVTKPGNVDVKRAVIDTKFITVK